MLYNVHPLHSIAFTHALQWNCGINNLLKMVLETRTHKLTQSKHILRHYCIIICSYRHTRMAQVRTRCVCLAPMNRKRRESNRIEHLRLCGKGVLVAMLLEWKCVILVGCETLIETNNMMYIDDVNIKCIYIHTWLPVRSSWIALGLFFYKWVVRRSNNIWLALNISYASTSQYDSVIYWYDEDENPTWSTVASP